MPVGIPFPAINRLLKKKELADLVDMCFEKCVRQRDDQVSG